MDNKTTILNKLMIEVQKNQDVLYVSNVMTEFQHAMQNPDIPLERIAAIIEKDTGLTSTVLRTANSSYYGLSKKVISVKQAISVLGYKTLEKLFLTQIIKKAFKEDKLNLSDNLWKHSLATAISSQILVELKFQKYSEQAFISGLLHDLGKFILYNFMQYETTELKNKIDKNQYQYSLPLELEIYGITHQDVGAFFAKQWQFPEIVVNCIRYHHSIDFADNHKEIIACVAIANNISKAMELGKSNSGVIELLPHWVWGFIGFKQKMFYNVMTQTLDKFNALTQFTD